MITHDDAWIVIYFKGLAVKSEIIQSPLFVNLDISREKFLALSDYISTWYGIEKV